MIWLYAAYNRHFRLNDTSKLKIKLCRNISCKHYNQKAGVTVSINIRKIAIKRKGVEREKKDIL